MRIFAMSDLHGCIKEFEYALSLIDLTPEDTKLILLGDYIHGGDSRAVIDKIIALQTAYGNKVIALAGNHDLWYLDGTASLDIPIRLFEDEDEPGDEKYAKWISSLPLYHVEGNTIFVHAGINENAGENWKSETTTYTCTMKEPAETGKIKGLNKKVVAGHIGTSSISGNPYFHDIYYDGKSHYYIDASAISSGKINILMVDTETDKYYSITRDGPQPIRPYDEEEYSFIT